MCWPGALQQACQVNNLLSYLLTNLGRRMVQRLVGSTYWLRATWFKHISDQASFNTLVGSKACGTLPGQIWPLVSGFNRPASKLAHCCGVKHYLNQLGLKTVDLASLYKLAGSKVCWTNLVQVGSNSLWPGKLVQAWTSLCKLAGSNICWSNWNQVGAK